MLRGVGDVGHRLVALAGAARKGLQFAIGAGRVAVHHQIEAIDVDVAAQHVQERRIQLAIRRQAHDLPFFAVDDVEAQQRADRVAVVQAQAGQRPVLPLGGPGAPDRSTLPLR